MIDQRNYCNFVSKSIVCQTNLVLSSHVTVVGSLFVLSDIKIFDIRAAYNSTTESAR